MAELAAAPIVIGAIHGGNSIIKKIRNLQPEKRIAKWDERIAFAVQMIDAQMENIRPEHLAVFTDQHDRLEKFMNFFMSLVEDGSLNFLDKKRIGDEYTKRARALVQLAQTTSTIAIIERAKCQVNHREIPRNANGKCGSCFPATYSAAEDSRSST